MSSGADEGAAVADARFAGKNWYALTLTATADGKPEFSAFSRWAGYTETQPRREIREASFVRPEQAIENWISLGRSVTVVDDETSFLLWYFVRGGDAVVEESIAGQYVPEMIEPTVTVPEGPLGGHKSVSLAPQGALDRVARGRVRMRVFERDDYRCRICGRRPGDFADLFLTAHHIRLWSKGGTTEEWNLITLCQACHEGRHPHEDLRLYNFIEGGSLSIDVTRLEAEHSAGVQRYRELMRKMLAGAKKSNGKSPRRRQSKGRPA